MPVATVVRERIPVIQAAEMLCHYSSTFARAESNLPLSPGLSSISFRRYAPFQLERAFLQYSETLSLGTCLILCAGVKTTEEVCALPDLMPDAPPPFLLHTDKTMT